jgi:hypothetical protein
MYVYLILLSLLPGHFEKTESGFRVTPAIVLVGQWVAELVKSFFASQPHQVKASKPKRKVKTNEETI